MAASSAVNIVLPSAQALQSNEQMMLLDAVDALRAHGLGEMLALPQLVVCGDQSSGKSSVLEAISGVPFPRKTNVCTRFATEVILRRAHFVRMSVTIVPSEDRLVQDREHISAFRHDLESIDDFENLFQEAKRTMGISDQKKNFSKDVLRVEFWGPTQPQLTLVDLPGLFHSETGGQTSDDVKLVDDLVTSYLKSPRSIILAIVNAKYDANNQVILNRARKVDPEGKRTIGIITKPDTIDSDEEERAFIKLARNKDVKFALGWHVVKNLPSSMDNAQQESRDEQETEFFNTNAGFSTLPKKDVGIASLRTRLSSVLFDQIKVELPRLVQDIESRIRTEKSAKDRLGRARSSLDDQKKFLIELSESFQSICRDAVAGHYDHDFFREDVDGERRLCANLMNKHYEFAEKLRRDGSSWKIIEEDDENDDVSSETTDESNESVDDGRKRSRSEAIVEACRVLKRNRGRELPGLPNPLLVGEIFRDYSRPWAGIAHAHIKDVWNTTRVFLEIVLGYLTDDDVREKILRHWLDPIMEKSLDLAKEKLEDLLEVHKDHPLTTNADFITNRKKIQEKRLKEDVRTDMDLVAAEDAFDNMNAYYKVALTLFMDNVPSLAIQSPIIRKLPSMLSPSAVSRMDDDIIRRIAGESQDKVREREDTLRRLAKLEDGARICREYTLRPSSIPRSTGLSANITPQRVSVGDRREKGKGKSDLRSSHSPSVSEDGRANLRANKQRTNPASSSVWGYNYNLQVPGDNIIRRPASSDSLFPAFSNSSVTQTGASNLFPEKTGASPAVSVTATRSSSGADLFRFTPSSTSSPDVVKNSTGPGLFGSGAVPAASSTAGKSPAVNRLFGSDPSPPGLLGHGAAPATNSTANKISTATGSFGSEFSPFSSQSAAKTSTGFGSFGSNAAQTSSPFTVKTSTGSGLFGSDTSPFSSHSTAKSPTGTSLFGSLAAPATSSATKSSTGTGLFGSDTSPLPSQSTNKSSTGTDSSGSATSKSPSPFGTLSTNSIFATASTSKTSKKETNLARVCQGSSTLHFSSTGQEIESSPVPMTRGYCQQLGFQPFLVHPDTNSPSGPLELFQSLVRSPFSNFSFEELRLADYAAGD